MFTLIITSLFLMVGTVLATVVAVRAWEYRPARLFVLLTAALVILNISNFLQVEATSVDIAAVGAVGSSLILVAVDIVLLMLLSALFVPQWWTGPHLIFWISLPYAVAGIALGVDAIARTRLFVDGMVLMNGGYVLKIASPGGYILNNLFLVGWFVHLGILLVSFVRIPQTRSVIALLGLAIAGATITNRLIAQFDLLRDISTFVSMSLLLLVLAYMVLRVRFLVVKRIALDLAFQAMREAVVVLDQEGHLVYANAQAEQLGLGTQPGVSTTLAQVGIDSGMIDRFAREPAAWQAVTRKIAQSLGPTMTSELLTLNQRQIALTLTPVFDAHHRARGLLLMGRDMTEIVTYTTRLQQEQRYLLTAIAQLEAEQQERAKLADAVRALSLPMIPILRGVLVLPLIGTFDPERSAEFMPRLLAGIQRERARLVFIDLTGIPLLDTVAATGLLRGVQAATLLGARCVLVGIRPDMAQALVAQGIPLTGFKTAATLAQALSAELHRQPPWLPAPL